MNKSGSQFLHYRTLHGVKVRAKVLVRHRDGSRTVEPWFYLDHDDKPNGPFIGGQKVRVMPRHIMPVADAAKAEG